MADLDDLVLIEEDDHLPSRPLSSRTASPAMSEVGCGHVINLEKDQFYQHLANSGEPSGRMRSRIPQPQTVEDFAPPPPPPPPPPSSQSLGPTPPNGGHAASTPGISVETPFPSIALHEDQPNEEGKSPKDSFAGLQSCQSKLKPASKGYNFPVTLHNSRPFNPNRRRRCAFNDAPPPPPAPLLPTSIWAKDVDGRVKGCGSSPILPPVCGMPKDVFNLPPPPSYGRKPTDSNFNNDVDHPPAFQCPPPPPPFYDGPNPNDFPCPLPPKFLPPPTLYSSLELRCPPYEPMIDRTVKFPTTTSPKKTTFPSRVGNLLHHRASPFDLHHWLWLLKYSEPERWYARPAEAELARLRRFEANGLGSELANLTAQGGGEERAPSTAAPVVKVWVGEVMSAVQHLHHWSMVGQQLPTAIGDDVQRRLDNEFLVYYSVVEAPERADDGDCEGDGDLDNVVRHISRNAFQGCEELAGGRKVYKVERTGSVDACLAHAWHNAFFNGWSTVFSCVVRGDVDLVKADEQGLGVNAFERVSYVGRLLEHDPQCHSSKIKIFY